MTKYIKSFWNWIFNSNEQKEVINEIVINDDNIKQGTNKDIAIDEPYDDELYYDDEIINYKINKNERKKMKHEMKRKEQYKKTHPDKFYA